MADDMRRRRELAARAFIMRRKDLGLTQEQVAQRAGVVVRTISNFENGRWPNARTRALIEEAVDWEPGEIERTATPPCSRIDPQLLDAVSRLSSDQLNELRELTERLAELQEQLHGRVRGKADDEESG